jgi:hypothetical protein
VQACPLTGFATVQFIASCVQTVGGTAGTAAGGAKQGHQPGEEAGLRATVSLIYLSLVSMVIT